MQKNIQIEAELFIELLNYFSDTESNAFMSDEIQKKLSEKLEKLINRELFTKYKRASTPEEREQARREYLEQRGIHKDWITEKEISYDNL